MIGWNELEMSNVPLFLKSVLLEWNDGGDYKMPREEFLNIITSLVIDVGIRKMTIEKAFIKHFEGGKDE